VKALAVVGCAAAAAAAAALSAATGSADPTQNLLNVVGEPYARAVAILRAQGVPASFGGAVGSDVAQSNCIVSSQKFLSVGKMQLMLDCTAEAQPEAPAPTRAAGAPAGGTPAPTARPTPGAPGVVTVIPKPVG
jgi:hypothetical protein